MNQEIKKYKKAFTKKALKNGFSSENIDKCLKYAQPLIINNLPIIYNLSHLCSLVGYNRNYIRRAMVSSRFFYRHFDIKKKNGTDRKISEPLPSLKEIQTWILNEILYKIQISKYAKAYIPKRSIKEHVKYHTGQPSILTLDIKDFFDSIKPKSCVSMLRNIGYSFQVSNAITSLCFIDKENTKKALKTLSQEVPKSLPQGSPSSPFLSNILLYKFDLIIGDYCESNKIKYTRYADDLAFSGNFNKGYLVTLVESELKKLGLELNHEKTQFRLPSQRQIISGVLVNKKTQVPKLKRNIIRNQMFYIKKFGLDSHLEKTKNERGNFLRHLIGKIDYILRLNPKDKEFIEYKTHLVTLKNSTK